MFYMARSKQAAARGVEAAARRDRIIDVAIRLAEEGGFENVRQRDVAAQAGVALGTLYKSFRGKGDILSAALHRETMALEARLAKRPAKGDTAQLRLTALFQTLTRALLRKPNYARAVLRAMTAGEPEVASNVIAHQVHVTRMILGALRDDGPESLASRPPNQQELKIALLLQQIWFSALVGWTAKLHGKNQVVVQVQQAAELLLAGAAALARQRDATAGNHVH
ncbi:MAG TPA: TetR/AcrR family transcriptional regulator [Sorangium sp.]|nr:TetR/AcrR family transcriptional regulator [Sorangium sp.]